MLGPQTPPPIRNLTRRKVFDILRASDSLSGEDVLPNLTLPIAEIFA